LRQRILEEKVLWAKNEFSQVDDEFGFLKRMITDTVFDKYNSYSIPPHRLTLKVDDICIILRNLNIEEGIANNTRVRVLGIGRYSIRVQTLESPINVFTLPRIRFKMKLPYGESFELLRTQFPLRRAFAMTNHKAQGQTLEKVVMDVRDMVFAHGQIYVGFSRVRNYDAMALIVNYSCIHNEENNECSIINIVYKEAIDECQI